jgi:hypothetical protein
VLLASPATVFANMIGSHLNITNEPFVGHFLETLAIVLKVGLFEGTKHAQILEHPTGAQNTLWTVPMKAVRTVQST